MNRLIRLMRYGGLTREEYLAVGPQASESNRKAIMLLSGMMLIAGGTMTVASGCFGVLSNNFYTYLYLLLASIYFFLTSWALGKKHPHYLQVNLYLCCVVLQTFGIFIGAVTNRETSAVFFMAVLLVVPILFTINAYGLISINLLMVVIFIIAVFHTKSGELLKIDLINALVYCAGSFIEICLVSRYRFDRLNVTRKMLEMQSREQTTRQIEAISEIYVAMYQINLEQNDFFAIRSYGPMEDCIKKHSELTKATEFMNEIVREVIKAKDVKRMQAFTDLNTLQDRMVGDEPLVTDFMGVSDRWFRCRFIPMKQVGEEKTSRFIFAVEIIDDEKKREDQLKKVAATDPLTGVYNRRGAEEEVGRYLHEDYGGMFCLMDVDGFKQINDEYGHQTGDEVLVKIVESLRENLRENDILMRLGGDEFAVYVPSITDEDEARPLLSRMLSGMNNMEVEGVGKGRVSLSIGATFRLDGMDCAFDDLYRIADKGTYLSKNTQGNSVTFMME